MSQISLCKKCYLWKISEEKHECILTGINFVQHEIKDDRAYIVKVSTDGSKWKDIQPIPSFMQIEAEREIID
jgi:hypothetical protein